MIKETHKKPERLIFIDRTPEQTCKGVLDF